MLWFLLFSSGYLKAKQYIEEENYDKIISECTKEVESGGRYTAEALILRAMFYLLIGNFTAAEPDMDQVVKMQGTNVKVLIMGLGDAAQYSTSLYLCSYRNLIH